MSSKKILFILFLVLLCAGLGSFYWYKTKFTRAYKNGTTFEQLNTLLNTTQYAKTIEAAGYNVDHYNLEMNRRVLPINIGNDISIDFIDIDRIKIMVGNDIYREYDSKMFVIDSYKIQNEKLTLQQLNDYNKQIKKQIQLFLDTIYHDMTT